MYIYYVNIESFNIDVNLKNMIYINCATVSGWLSGERVRLSQGRS